MSDEDKLAKFIADDLFTWFKDERNQLYEQTWRRGYDAFRGRYDSAALKRWKATEGKDWRSKVFVRLTKQKVVAGYNQVRAISLRGNDIRWDISPTPIPELAPGVHLDPDTAALRCELMKKQIQDDFTQCKASTQTTMAILEMALYGHSWLWGPLYRSTSYVTVDFGVPGSQGMDYSPEILQQYGRHTLRRKAVWRPTVENPGVWSVFWDLETPDHQKGQGVIVREMMSKGRFISLMERPGYDKKAIGQIADQFKSMDEASAEEDDSQGPVREQYNKRKRVIPVYTFMGRVPIKYLKKYDGESAGDLRRLDGAEAEIQCIVAKGKTPLVIWAPRINPLPYRNIYKAEWERLPHEAGGVGLPENIEDSQMIVNGLTRTMLDNKALSSNLLMWWNPRNLAPGQNKSLYPGKAFETNENVDDVHKALGFYSPPDITGNTPKLIEFFRQFADDESGLARTLEGQKMDARTTAYEISKVTESGNKMIGGTVSNHDEGHITPLVTGFYHWHMLTNPREEIKGDYTPRAKGWESYLEKAERGQNIMELMKLSLSSEYTAQFTKVLRFLREAARAYDLDPDNFYPTDKEVDEQAENLARQLPQMRPQLMAPQGEQP